MPPSAHEAHGLEAGQAATGIEEHRVESVAAGGKPRRSIDVSVARPPLIPAIRISIPLGSTVTALFGEGGPPPGIIVSRWVRTQNTSTVVSGLWKTG